jgi:hypothetical protein
LLPSIADICACQTISQFGGVVCRGNVGHDLPIKHLLLVLALVMAALSFTVPDPPISPILTISYIKELLGALHGGEAVSFTVPDSPIPPILPVNIDDVVGSNAPLSSMESSPIISYIEELESQIALLDEATAALQLRRADLLQSVKFHTSFLSPVRRLPPEILGYFPSLFTPVSRTTAIYP